MFICEIWLFNWYFLNSAHLICRSTDISVIISVSEGPFDFEITRVYGGYQEITSLAKLSEHPSHIGLV